MAHLEGFNLEPLYDLVIVKPYPPPQSPSGLTIPTLRNYAQLGKVMAVGQGMFSNAKLVAVDLHPNDDVYVETFNQQNKLEYKKETYYVFKAESIIGKVQRNEL